MARASQRKVGERGRTGENKARVAARSRLFTPALALENVRCAQPERDLVLRRIGVVVDQQVGLVVADFGSDQGAGERLDIERGRDAPEPVPGVGGEARSE